MKSYVYLFLSVILFASCLNDDENIELETEANIIKYINDNSLNATKTDSGLYYVNSAVNIDYKLSFLDGTPIGQSDSEIIELKQIIPGLSEGIQLFKEGGEGVL